MFLFFSNGSTPVLVALLAGEASTLMDRIQEEIIVTKAMSILASIFGASCPKKVKLNIYIVLFI